MHKVQSNFSDGFDQIAADTDISSKGYFYLINARQRLGRIQPNKKPVEIEEVPRGLKQGCIAVDDFLIVFIAGTAWYNKAGTSRWIKVAGFLMSTTVERFYSENIPFGTVAYVRKLPIDGDANKAIRKTFSFAINGTPAGVLVQDGVNQPWLITSNGSTLSARKTQEYSEWENNGVQREYVPIGKQMVVIDSKLLIVAPDGKSVYHSISGRYLDFMVNVDVNGDKLPTESDGGAATVSFNFDAAEITCIKDINIPSSFFYGTSRIGRIISFDYNNTLFGEPNPFVAAKVTVGTVNQYSFLDILGDFAVIDFEGVKSFNAVQTFKVEGRNSIFSLNLAKILHRTNETKPIKQTRPNCVSFNNYALFVLDTTYGNIIVVYDTVLQRWVGFDITEAHAIKQFAIVETEDESILYAVTEYDKLFKLYSSNESESAQIFTRAFTAVDDTNGQNLFITQKGEYFKAYFADGSSNATVRLTQLVDGQKSVQLSSLLPSNIVGMSLPFSFPFMFADKQTAEPITFNLREGLKGQKQSYIIQWDSDAELQAIELQTSEEISAVAKKQSERVVTN